VNIWQMLATWFCLHSLTILRWDQQNGRMWTECLKCGHASEGVQVRGPRIA
jgi:hypothetical protein